jgi:aspartate dehydrogenase
MESNGTRRPLRLAIAGLGAIGLAIARRVDAGQIEGVTLAAVAARDHARAKQRLSDFATAPAVLPVADLAEAADVVVECAPAAVFLDIARPALEQGRLFMPLSVGMLLDNMALIDLARQSGGRIVVPSGAILGLDAVRAVARGTVHSVTMISRKPPAALDGAPFLKDRAISLTGLSEAKLLFAGPAREAAKGFPANLNVCAAVALAGIGPDATTVEIWADPAVRHNTHTIEVKSDSSDLTMTIQNTPSLENPRTGKITALSVIAALERLTAPLTVGT